MSRPRPLTLFAGSHESGYRATPSVRPPVPALVPAAVAVVFLVVPLLYAAWRVDYGQLAVTLTAPEARDALRLSVITCASSTLICIAVGSPLALWLAQLPSRWWVHLLRTVVSVPMVVPPVVAGLMLLLVFGRRGLLGHALTVAGIDVTFTTVAVVLAQSFVALPFFVSSLENALRSRGFAYEHAARALGASRRRVLWTVTVPITIPAAVSAAALALSRALGEFGATMTFAGSLQGVTRTLPLEIYLQTETNLDTALALSLVLVLVAVVALIGSSLLTGWWNTRLNPPQGTHAADQDGIDAVPRELPQLHTTPTDGVLVDATLPERGLDARIQCLPGETIGLTGANGTGKSTLLALAAGRLHHPAAHVSWLSPDGRARKAEDNPPRIALLEQKPTLLPHLTVLSNVAYGLRSRGVERHRASERAHAELRAVGADHLHHRRIHTLSGGQAQRVALARALATDPMVVLLDEPFTGVDEQTVHQLRSGLAKRLRCTTTVLVTHDRRDVRAFGATDVRLHRGHPVGREGVAVPGS